jgi:hypothetical protein
MNAESWGEVPDTGIPEFVVKIILSRKGFDSSVGGCASPILPDGTMLSLPIPTSTDIASFDDIRVPGGRTYADVIGSLLGKQSPILQKAAHLDPDLASGALERKPGWRGALGQTGAAAGHLRNQQVGPGDLFLFYGWFRPVESHGNEFRFMSRDSGFHAIFGYLEVSEVFTAPTLKMLPDWLKHHPHAIPARLKNPTNTFYVSAPALSGNAPKPGWGTFRFNERLVLSHRAMSRSRWCLEPRLFKHLSISYHTSDAWKDGYFQSYPRAQEYVIQADDAVRDWAWGLVRDSENWSE